MLSLLIVNSPICGNKAFSSPKQRTECLLLSDRNKGFMAKVYTTFYVNTGAVVRISGKS
jgi:hypothetical protein